MRDYNQRIKEYIANMDLGHGLGHGHADEILYMDDFTEDMSQPLTSVHTTGRITSSPSDAPKKEEEEPQPLNKDAELLKLDDLTATAGLSEKEMTAHTLNSNNTEDTVIPIDEDHSDVEENELHSLDFNDTLGIPSIGLRSAFSEDDVSHPLTSRTSGAVPFIGPRIGNLLETDNDPAKNPQPTSGPEIDDDTPKIGPSVFMDNKGIDDGFLPGMLSPGMPRIPSDRPLFSTPPESIPDVNIYQHKKTLAQGMMDLALLSANANQLRYVLQTDGRHPYFYPSLVMIGTSLFLQIAVGIGLIWNSRYNVKEHAQMCKANKANNLTVIGIFLVTILNVFISSFGVGDQGSVAVTR